MAILRFSRSRIFVTLLMVLFMVAQMGLAVPGYAAMAETAQKVTGQSQYKDVTLTDPNYIFIKYLNGVGLLQGFPDRSFRPASGLTRAEAAVLLVKAGGLKPVGGKPAFKDVSAKHWAAASIAAVKNAGLLTGYPDGTFRPQATLTRAEGITLLLKLSKQADAGAELPNLADVTPKHWAARSVAVGLASEMMGLSSDNRHFLPDTPLNRGALARALAILLTKDPALYVTNLSDKLSVVAGAVTVNRTGNSNPETIKDTTELRTGDTVYTGVNGQADIIFPDGTGLRLEKDSQFTLKETRGRSYIKTDGTPGIAVEWLGAELKRGKMFGALATTIEAANTTASIVYNNNGTGSSNSPDSKVKTAGLKARAMGLGSLSENKIQTAAIESKPLPWWQQSGVKRTKVKIDMPTGVAAIRGTFWETAVNPDGSFVTSLLTGSAEITSGGQSVNLIGGQRTEVASAGAPPAAPALLTQEDKREWVEQKVWAEQRAQEIQNNLEQQLPPPAPADKPEQPVPAPPEKSEQPGTLPQSTIGTTEIISNAISEVSSGLSPANSAASSGGSSGVSSTGSTFTTARIVTLGEPYHVIGENIGVMIYDSDMNKTSSVDTVSVHVNLFGLSSGGINVTLQETGANTGVFEGFFALAGPGQTVSNGINVSVGNTVEITYTDAVDASGQVNQPRVTDIVVTDLAQNVSLAYPTCSANYFYGELNWKAASDQSVITHYAVYFLDSFDNIVGPEVYSYPVVAGQVYYQYYLDTTLPAGASQIGVFSRNANDHNYKSAAAGKVVFNPGSFTPTVNGLVYGRYLNSATRLSDGRVLFVGGYVYNPPTEGLTVTAEAFDPVTGLFSRVGDLNNTRAYHNAALLPDGRVLITGGMSDTLEGLYSQEFFDPMTNSFTSVSVSDTVYNLVYNRVWSSATKLNDGTVLITGGQDVYNSQSLASAGVFGVNGLASVNNMVYARWAHTATLLKDDRVLILGGVDNRSGIDVPVGNPEIYDPATGTFSLVGEQMKIPRLGHTATLLQDGKVLVTGGMANVNATTNDYVYKAELWDPVTKTFSYVGDLQQPRVMASATLLPNGWVLITGGTDVNSTEIYLPSLKGFINGPAMTEGRYYESAVGLSDGTVLIAGGASANGFPHQGMIYKLP